MFGIELDAEAKESKDIQAHHVLSIAGETEWTPKNIQDAFGTTVEIYMQTVPAPANNRLPFFQRSGRLARRRNATSAPTDPYVKMSPFYAFRVYETHTEPQRVLGLIEEFSDPGMIKIGITPVFPREKTLPASCNIQICTQYAGKALMCEDFFKGQIKKFKAQHLKDLYFLAKKIKSNSNEFSDILLVWTRK